VQPRWQPLNLASSEYELEPDPPHPDYSGLLYVGKRHVVSAPTESLKTMIVMAIALDAIRAGRKMASIDFEMGPHAMRRLLVDLGATQEELATVHYVQPDGPPSKADIEAIVGKGIDIVVFDASMGAFHASGLDDNKRQDVEKFAATWIDPLWQRGIGTVVLDHVTKNIEGRGRYAIGSERKVGQVDVHLGLELVSQLTRGGLGLVKVHVHKDRPGFLQRPYAAEIAFTSEPDTHAISWQIRPTATANPTAGWQPTILMGRAIDFLEQQTEPVSRTAVAAGIGKNKQQALRAIDILIAKGDIHESPGPRNAKLLTLTRTAVPEQFQNCDPR
jgi:hypothetical protein